MNFRVIIDSEFNSWSQYTYISTESYLGFSPRPRFWKWSAPVVLGIL